MVLVAGSSLGDLLCSGLFLIVWLLEAAVAGGVELVSGPGRWEAFAGSPPRFSILGQRHYKVAVMI
jgi:hypothetical protein